MERVLVAETTSSGKVILHVDGKNYPLSINDDNMSDRLRQIESKFKSHEDQMRCNTAFYNHDMNRCLTKIKKLQWLCGGLIIWTVLQLIMSVV